MSVRRHKILTVEFPPLDSPDAELRIKDLCERIEPALIVSANVYEGRLVIVYEEYDFVSPDEEPPPCGYIVQLERGTDEETIERLVKAIVVDTGFLVSLLQGDGVTCGIAVADSRDRLVYMVDLSPSP